MIKPAKFETHYYTTITNIVLIACLFFNSYSTHLFAVDVEISKFETVSTKVSTNITVTLSPSPVMEEETVCLNLRATEGTGKAVFLPGGHMSTNTSETSTLQIKGEQLSSVEGNMILEAKVKEMVVASNVFKVVDIDMATESRAIKTTATANQGKVKDKEEMITKNQAIEIARAAIKGRLKTYEGAPITVELKGKDYFVTFGWIPPKRTKSGPIMGPSYAAKVTLDAFTGSVKKILASDE